MMGNIIFDGWSNFRGLWRKLSGSGNVEHAGTVDYKRKTYPADTAL